MTTRPRRDQRRLRDTQRPRPDRADRATRTRRHRARRHLQRAHQRASRRRPPRLALLLGLAGSAVLGAVSAHTLTPAALAWLAPEAGLAAIAVQGHERLSALRVARATGLTAGQPLSEGDPASVVRALETDPWIASARALRLPTGTLLVGVEERQPRALLSPAAPAGFEGGGKGLKAGEKPDGRWIAVDAQGRAFAPVDAERWPELPRLHTWTASARDASADDALLAQAVRLAASLPRYGIATGAGLAIELPRTQAGDAERASSWILRTQRPSLEIWLGATPHEKALERLAELLEAKLPAVELSLDEKNPLRIDVRFRDRAILRASGPSLPTGA